MPCPGCREDRREAQSQEGVDAADIDTVNEELKEEPHLRLHDVDQLVLAVFYFLHCNRLRYRAVVAEDAIACDASEAANAHDCVAQLLARLLPVGERRA